MSVVNNEMCEMVLVRAQRALTGSRPANHTATFNHGIVRSFNFGCRTWGSVHEVDMVVSAVSVVPSGADVLRWLLVVAEVFRGDIDSQR